MNPETWAYIHHLFFAEKLPKKLIARKLGLDIKTIRRALKKNTFSQKHTGPRGSKLDTFKDKIHDLLKNYPGMSGERIGEDRPGRRGPSRLGLCGNDPGGTHPP